MTRPRCTTAAAARRLAALMVVAAALGACGVEGGRTEYSDHPDSGAVAPAARLDTSTAPNLPDSTSGESRRTGRPGAAGDTLSGRRPPGKP